MRREAQIARHLSHRAVTNYIGLFVEEGQTFDEGADFYLVSDYVNGGVARKYLAENWRLEAAETLVSKRQRVSIHY